MRLITLALVAMLSGCCAPSTAVSSQVNAALRAPEYSSAIVDGLVVELGREVVCALRQIAAGVTSQAADQQRQLAHDRAAAWLKAHGQTRVQ